ncbi:MAG: hypothetical protein H0T66_06645 [Geodermatophilaceae bacterium]|nr:hypothetical protein [Geodermatophilaceae bacterium]
MKGTHVRYVHWRPVVQRPARQTVLLAGRNARTTALTAVHVDGTLRWQRRLVGSTGGGFAAGRSLLVDQSTGNLFLSGPDSYDQGEPEQFTTIALAPQGRQRWSTSSTAPQGSGFAAGPGVLDPATGRLSVAANNQIVGADERVTYRAALFTYEPQGQVRASSLFAGVRESFTETVSLDPRLG